MYGITEAKYEMTGGGCFTFWGKAKGGYFLSDIEGNITLYDTDTNEYMEKLLNDEDFDAYEWKKEHQIKDANIDNQRFLEEMFENLGDSAEVRRLRNSFIK